MAPALMAAATPIVQGPLDDCAIPRTFRLRDLWPARVMAEDDANSQGVLSRLLDACTPAVIQMFERIDCFPSIMDPLRCPTHLLDHLLYHRGNPFILEEGMSDQEKRRLLSVLFTLYALKGTCYGIIGAIRTLYDINVTECIEANLDGWILDESELDIDTVLAPSTGFERRAFSIMVDVNLTDRQRKQIRNVVNWIKPAGTHFARIVEPGAADHIDHWVLNFSKLNLNTILHQ